MDKITNIACLILWAMTLGLAILDAATGGVISPVAHVCACLICVLHYAEKLIMGDDE